MVQPTATETIYTHVSEPRAAKQGKGAAKFRNPKNPEAPNIMFDRRVVRGNTYAAQIVPTETLDVATRSTLGRSTMKKATAVAPRATTPDPVEGRRHMDVQTDTYLEELTDIVPEIDVQTQTEPFIDRPPTPLFMPKKSGIDIATQIEAGDLFDFDFEVEPILEVLVGKVLEQGLTEVMEEEELKAMRAHQEHFEQIRNAELIATQRMEEAEKRKLAEKERRLAQERERVERERVLREKVAACAFARGYLNGMVGTVFQDLYRTGHFFNPVERDIVQSFMPWLQGQVLRAAERESGSRAAARSVVERALEVLREAKERAEADRVEEVRRKEEEARRAAAERAARDARTRGVLADKAVWVLTDAEPKIVSEEQVAAVRAEIEAKHNAWAEAEHKVLQETAAGRARMAYYAAHDADAEEEAHEEGGEEGAQPEGEPEELKKAVEEAVAGVPRPDPKPVTESMILLAVWDTAAQEWRDTLLKAVEGAFPETTAVIDGVVPAAEPSEVPAASEGEPAPEEEAE